MEKSKYLLLILFFVAAFRGFSQCPQGDKYFQNQTQINYFVEECSDVDTIHGLLIIGDLHSNITDISGLLNLRVILGGITIQHNDSLTNLGGLDSISSIGGGLTIHNNLALVSLTHLKGITEINGSISINKNDSLQNLDGLDSVQLFDGDLLITKNNLLTSLQGLKSIQNAIGSVRIHDNPLLPNLAGLDSLTRIQGDLTIQSNDSLQTLSGLDSLATIGGLCSITYNPSLVSLDAFANLESIGGDLFIGSNDSLSDCTGICGLLIDEYAIGGSISIGNNLAECANNATITPLCTVLPTIHAQKKKFKIFPNPAQYTLEIETNYLEEIQQIEIFSISGQKVDTPIFSKNKHIKISTLSSGMYILALSTNNQVFYQKFVVE